MGSSRPAPPIEKTQQEDVGEVPSAVPGPSWVAEEQRLWDFFFCPSLWHREGSPGGLFPGLSASEGGFHLGPRSLASVEGQRKLVNWGSGASATDGVRWHSHTCV